MLRSIACRCMEKDWTEDLGSKLKLCVLNAVYVNSLNGRCWKVQEKSHRRMLMMLRGGSTLQIPPFHMTTQNRFSPFTWALSFPFQVIPRCGNIGKGLASVPDPRHPTLHRTTYDSISDERDHDFA